MKQNALLGTVTDADIDELKKALYNNYVGRNVSTNVAFAMNKLAKRDANNESVIIHSWV